MRNDIKPKGIMFVSVGARVITPDFIDFVLRRAVTECSSFTMCLLDDPEIINLIRLNDTPDEQARSLVKARCDEIVSQIRRHELTQVLVKSSSDFACLDSFLRYKSVIFEAYATDSRFRRHIHSQTFRNLQPILRRKGVNSKTHEVVARVSEYLLLEVSLKLLVANEAWADIEYGVENEMNLMQAIYLGKYAGLRTLAKRALRFVVLSPHVNPGGLVLQDVLYAYPSGTFKIQVSNLHISAGRRFGIMGPNGSGKTTILKIIGGHLRPNQGKVIWNGQDLSDLPAGQRPIATVFQDHALFSHMSVLRNVAFGIECRKTWRREEIRRIAKEWLGRLGLEQYQDRMPDQLSLGTQQRVAIARALAVEPAVLLLDEPTASLDSQQRNELMMMVKRASEASWAPTTVIVSHDRDFTLRVCDQIAVVEGGKLIAEGPGHDIYVSPPTVRVARYLDSANVITGSVDGSLLFTADKTKLELIVPKHLSGLRSGKAALLIAPDLVRLQPSLSGDEIVLEGVVEELLCKGRSYTLITKIGEGDSFRCEGYSTKDGLRVAKGDLVTLYIEKESLLLVPDD